MVEEWLISVGDEKGTDWIGQVSEKDVDDHPTNRAGRPKDIADACKQIPWTNCL
jgi:hypothetical protein